MKLSGQHALSVLAVLAVLAVLGIVVAGITVFASRQREQPARCGPGLVAMGFRCCAAGQRFEGGHCKGPPRACPPPFTMSNQGCVANHRRVTFAGGRVGGRAAEWQSDDAVPPSHVGAFALDAFEVTMDRWERCVTAGQCSPLRAAEPGLPATRVGGEAARHFCRFAGGRLPTSAEWMFAAMGREGRRYPWGTTGLVCRRATYGLEQACATSGTGPDWTGARTDGATPEGVHDMAGNVAEWTLEPDGHAVARGGSFRSTAARELKTTAAEDKSAGPDVGFRCAYDIDQNVSSAHP